MIPKVDDNLRWLEANAGEHEAQAQADIVRALGARLDDKRKAQLEAIGRALVRIASGEYGRCISCGTDIPHEHLEEFPTMENCPPARMARFVSNIGTAQLLRLLHRAPDPGVMAIVTILLGAVCLYNLPVAQYPQIA